MRILHLSDFHYKSSSKDIASQNRLVEKLLENLDNEEGIDFLLFTGDLVFSGGNNQHFDEAYKTLLERVGLKLGLKKRNILLCQGNHDVDRSHISDPIKSYFRAIKTSEQLNKIVEDDKPDVFGISCKPTSNYHQFELDFYKKGIELGISYVSPLVSVHLREYDQVKIGFVSINTAWCSTGDDDKGNLFFPKSQIEIAL